MFLDSRLQEDLLHLGDRLLHRWQSRRLFCCSLEQLRQAMWPQGSNRTLGYLWRQIVHGWIWMASESSPWRCESLGRLESILRSASTVSVWP